MKLMIAVSPEDHVQGPANAKVTLVEYGDYQCPHCGRAYPVVKRIQKHFGDSLRFVFRNFPLTQVHPYAQVAAEATEFAATQGKFWEMHDAIYEEQERLSDEFLIELGIRFKLKGLSKALQDGSFAEKVRRDFIGGARSGVNGTPTFFINGLRYDGAPDFEGLAAAITRISARETKPPY